MIKLFVSDEAIEEKGKEYFEDYSLSDLKRIADPEGFVRLDDGLFLSRDDMDNLYISKTEEDECFEEMKLD